MRKYLIILSLALFTINSKAEVGITVYRGQPAPIDGQIQYNNGGEFGATTNVWYDDVNSWFGIVPSLADVRREFTFNGADIRTQQYLNEDTNLNLGYETFGAGNLGGGSGDNIALGYQSLYSISNGASFNVAVGSLSLASVTTADNNTAVGYSALNGLVSSAGNTAVGYLCMDAATGAGNAAFGINSLRNTTGNNNTAIGPYALEQNLSGIRNTAVGYNALNANTNGNHSVAVGYGAAALGHGDENVSVGYNAMPNCNGNDNIMLGANVAGGAITGNSNIGMGDSVFSIMTSGSSNLGLGKNALRLVVDGIRNVGLGEQSLRNTTGDGNIGLGYSAGNNITSGNNNFAAGYLVDIQDPTASNQMVIQNAIYGIDCDGTTTNISTSAKIGIKTPNMVADFEVNGSKGDKVTEVDAATYTIDIEDRIIAVDYTGTGAVTLTLPSCTTAWNSIQGIGIAYLIKDTGANSGTFAITINRAGGDTIITTATGQTSTSINSNGGFLWIQAKDATTWMVY